jgi:tetratricopeptide (TPR) repeat protein
VLYRRASHGDACASMPRAGQAESRGSPGQGVIAMNRPRLFLSAVSEELGSARRAVAATVRTLGYDPVSQDDFPTGHGELRAWLRKQIDSCEGLIQIVGQSYGGEPPDVDPAFGRVSYTQYEFLYARRQGRKTWVIVAGQQCQRDKPLDQLDLPRNPGQADPSGYQSERRKLQADYFARLKQENHVRNMANSAIELENVVLKLRDELGELRKGWDKWLQSHADFTSNTSAQLAELVENSRITTERIRAHLLETVAETHRRELTEADREADWRDRQRLRDAADAANAARLARIEELAASFAEIEGRGTSTVVFQELTRILSEQGVDEAIAYVASQRSSILQAVRARANTASERNRSDLQPLLKAAALYESKGQPAEARSLYKDILAAEPDWPDALHAGFWFLVNHGDDAFVHTTLADALRDYEEAQRLARRLVENDTSNRQWRRDLSVSYNKLGDVAIAQGKLDEAARSYGDGLTIRKTLADADPSNRQWQQRDLSVSYNKLGDVAMAQGKLEESARNYRDGLTIAKKLADADPGNTGWQRDLSVFYNKLGDVAMAQGKLEEATRNYGDSLAIRKKLADADPSNTEWQRDLSVSYNMLGNVAMAQGKRDEAVEYYAEDMAITKKLAEADPSNAEWQRDLSVSYGKIGDVALTQGKLDDAARNYGDALTIRKKLAEADPSNAVWQRDLSVSYNKLGDVTMAQGELDGAAQNYGDALTIRKKLAEADPSNTQWQRDLAVSYAKLATLAERQGNDAEARAYRKQALDILAGIEKTGLHLSPDDRKALEILRQEVAKEP